MVKILLATAPHQMLQSARLSCKLEHLAKQTFAGQVHLLPTGETENAFIEAYRDSRLTESCSHLFLHWTRDKERADFP